MTCARALLPLLLAALLPACTLVDLEPRPLAIFDLRAAPVVALPTPVTGILAVAEPEALAPVASDRIVVRGADGALGVLADARWAGSGPRLVQELLLQGLEDGRAAAAVVRRGSGVAPDCMLGGDLRAFEYRPGDGTVRVVLQARLSCAGASGAPSSARFEAAAPVRGDGAVAVVGAFDAAMAELVPAVVSWVVDAGG